MNSNAKFVEDLLRLVPLLKSVYEEHILDNDELLPHMFLGDVTWWVIAEAGKASRRDDLVRLLDLMEKGLTKGAEEVQEMIVVSFVENLQGEPAALGVLKPLMGPTLRKWVDAICG